MDENIEMLEYIYQTSSMGASSMTDLINALHNKDNKIKKILEEQLKCYEKYTKESKKILEKRKVKPKDIGIMVKTMSKIEINKEIIKDNSDAAIADLLIQGFTMGNLEMEKKINNYENKIDKKILNIAKELLKFGENNINKMKSYL